MGNYCAGTMYCTGDTAKLTQLYSLLEDLTGLSKRTGFEGDGEWMGHVLTEDVMPEGLFYEGSSWAGETLEVYMRTLNTDGATSVQGLANATNSTIKWEYVSDSDGREHKCTLKPKAKPAWKLRSIQDETAEGDPNVYLGAASISGDITVLRSIDVLLKQIGMGISRVSRSLSSIFEQATSSDDVSYNGHVLISDHLTIYTGNMPTDGAHFFETMANSLGLEIVYTITDTRTGRMDTFTYNAGAKMCTGDWVLKGQSVQTARVYEGTAAIYRSILRGDSIQKLSEALSHLEEYSKVTGYGKPENWLPHIFTTKVTDENIFYKGSTGSMGTGSELMINVRVVGSDATVFFEALAKQLGVVIKWVRSTTDGATLENVYNRQATKRLGEWQLRTENTTTMTAESLVELQLSIAAAVSVRKNITLAGDDYLESLLVATMVQHVYLAGLQLRDLLLSERQTCKMHPDWDEFIRRLSAFNGVLPDNLQEVRAINPGLYDQQSLRELTIAADAVLKSIRKLYAYYYPSRIMLLHSISVNF